MASIFTQKSRRKLSLVTRVTVVAAPLTAIHEHSSDRLVGTERHLLCHWLHCQQGDFDSCGCMQGVTDPPHPHLSWSWRTVASIVPGGGGSSLLVGGYNLKLPEQTWDMCIFNLYELHHVPVA